MMSRFRRSRGGFSPARLAAGCGATCRWVYAAEAGSSPAAPWSPSSPVIWLLLAGIVVMFMHVGFAIVETGFCRANRALNTTAITLMVFPLGSLAFWSYGFAVRQGNLPGRSVSTGFSRTAGAASPAVAATRATPVAWRTAVRNAGLLRSIADWVSAG